MNIFRYIALCLMLAFPCVSSYAQTYTALDSLVMGFGSYADSAASAFQRYSEQALEEYLRYSRTAAEEYGHYISSIQDIWGIDNAADDTPSVWVEYSRDMKDRSIVDFKSGSITVEVITDTEDPETIEKLLASALVRTLSSRGSSCPYKSSVDESFPLTERPVLEGLLDLSGYDVAPKRTEMTSAPPAPTVRGKKLEARRDAKKSEQAEGSGRDMPAARKRISKEEEVRETARMIAEQSSKTIIRDSSGGKERRYVQITLPLAEDNLSKNAAIYKDLVKEFATAFGVEPALVFAVMEQESMFNPEATSHIPAYGLMQLVPESGGTDAYRYVYGRSWIPTRSYLFDPRNNIELGTAYLCMLDRQFSKVTDRECRRLCVIASYNTGAGNVSRAFTGNTNLSKAFKKINSYGFRQLYDFLTTELGSEEARNYVSGVSKRREKYLKK